MFSDISSLLNTTKNQQASNSNALSNTGTLAKLFSEIKLIDSLSLIRFQGSEVLNQQGKSVQLLHAIGPKQPFTLINSGTPINLDNIKTAELSKSGNNTATLTTTQNTTTNQANNIKVQANNRIENLTLASRVLNLTVVSTPIPSTANSTLSQTPQSQTTQTALAPTPATTKVNNTNVAMSANSELTNIQTVPNKKNTEAQANTPVQPSVSSKAFQHTSTIANPQNIQAPDKSSTLPNTIVNPPSAKASNSASTLSNTTSNPLGTQASNTSSPTNKALEQVFQKTNQSITSASAPTTPSTLGKSVAGQATTQSLSNQPATSSPARVNNAPVETPPQQAEKNLNRKPNTNTPLAPPVPQNTITQQKNTPSSTQAPISQTNLLQPSQPITNTSLPTEPQKNLSTEDVQTSPPVNTRPDSSSPKTATGSPYVVTVTDGKTEFPLISQSELKRGEIIRVFVDANNNLQVLPPKNQSEVTSPQFEALKQSLPKQLSFSEMSQLVKVLHNVSGSTALPIQTQAALNQLLQGIPSTGDLTTSPEAMKQAIQNSGLFSESALLKNSTNQLSDDLKLNLSRLKDVQESSGNLRLGSIPTEQIANAIERITTSQLRHFPDTNQTAATNYPLYIELPIKNGSFQELVQIEIDQDSSTEREQKQERRWLVKLKFDFEETGRFEARSSIQGSKVSVIFVAEEKETTQRLQQNMGQLKTQLRNKSIEVERLDTFQAELKSTGKETRPPKTPLIDVRT